MLQRSDSRHRQAGNISSKLLSKAGGDILGQNLAPTLCVYNAGSSLKGAVWAMLQGSSNPETNANQFNRLLSWLVAFTRGAVLDHFELTVLNRFGLFFDGLGMFLDTISCPTWRKRSQLNCKHLWAAIITLLRCSRVSRITLLTLLTQLPMLLYNRNL